jgi:hypothetical protein
MKNAWMYTVMTIWNFTQVVILKDIIAAASTTTIIVTKNYNNELNCVTYPYTFWFNILMTS